jgi:hypothetical protein
MGRPDMARKVKAGTALRVLISVKRAIPTLIETR